MTEDQQATLVALEGRARAIAEGYRLSATRPEAARVDATRCNYARVIVEAAERRIRDLGQEELQASREWVEAGLWDQFDRALQASAVDLSTEERFGIFTAVRRRFDAQAGECTRRLAALVAIWSAWRRIEVWRAAVSELSALERDRVVFETMPADVLDALETRH